MVTRFLLCVIANVLAIVVSARILPGVSFEYDSSVLIKISLLLALVNFFLKPILKIAFSPLILATLGLFTLIINVFLVWLAVEMVPGLSITGLGCYLGIAIIISVFNFIVSIFTGKS